MVFWVWVRVLFLRLLLVWCVLIVVIFVFRVVCFLIVCKVLMCGCRSVMLFICFRIMFFFCIWWWCRILFLVWYVVVLICVVLLSIWWCVSGCRFLNWRLLFIVVWCRFLVVSGSGWCWCVCWWLNLICFCWMNFFLYWICFCVSVCVVSWLSCRVVCKYWCCLLFMIWLMWKCWGRWCLNCVMVVCIVFDFGCLIFGRWLKKNCIFVECGIKFGDFFVGLCKDVGWCYIIYIYLNFGMVLFRLFFWFCCWRIVYFWLNCVELWLMIGFVGWFGLWCWSSWC